MKLISILLTSIIVASIVFCHAKSNQAIDTSLRTFQAIQAKDADYFDYEDYEAPDKPIGKLEFLKGCSWYCGGYVDKISASSSLSSQGSNTYFPNNAHDFNKDTAWIEGAAGYGIGETIKFEFSFDSMANYEGSLGVTSILLANGYKKSETHWSENSRVKSMKMYLNDELYASIALLDSYEIQVIDIGQIMFPRGQRTILKFEITDVYPGTKYKDTAISLLMFDGVGVH